MRGSCGQVFGRKVWNSTDERFRRIIWRCNGKYPVKGKKGCESRHIDDKILYQAFINVFNVLMKNKDYFLEKWQGRLTSDNASVGLSQAVSYLLSSSLTTSMRPL